VQPLRDLSPLRALLIDNQFLLCNPHAGQDSDTKVRELLEPIGGPGQEKLVLGFDRLSVWAPVNPKKPNLLETAWKKTVSCGKAERNPQRQILFDVSGQVGRV
jgi:hypothetical protein